MQVKDLASTAPTVAEVATLVWVQPLAWELPYASGAAKKKVQAIFLKFLQNSKPMAYNHGIRGYESYCARMELKDIHVHDNVYTFFFKQK